jgi:hypothetical protein
MLRNQKRRRNWYLLFMQPLRENRPSAVLSLPQHLNLRISPALVEKTGKNASYLPGSLTTTIWHSEETFHRQLPGQDG